ncbi:cyclic peptide transporter [Calothrix sp. NIES-4071]|nr:cyclic peptide transporter [Calothrix sp. NIES-4071]BAZ59807.1 cyclic peptide transporter [Calothrix sp. NIES-4105]
MNLIWFLLHASKVTVAIAALTGALNGACSVLLIASINKALSSNSTESNQLMWSFIGLAIVLWLGISTVAKLVSKIWKYHRNLLQV